MTDATMSSSHTECVTEIHAPKPPQITIRNHPGLTPPEGTAPQILPVELYHPSHTLPELASHPPFSLLPVAILSPHLTWDNIAVRECRVWGTGIFTDDSDVVAAMIHDGKWAPKLPHPLLRDWPPASVSATNGFVPMAPPVHMTQAATAAWHVARATMRACRAQPVIDKAGADGVIVWLRTLPVLEYYTGTVRNSVKSRGWGDVPAKPTAGSTGTEGFVPASGKPADKKRKSSLHDGVSFEILSVVPWPAHSRMLTVQVPIKSDQEAHVTLVPQRLMRKEMLGSWVFSLSDEVSKETLHTLQQQVKTFRRSHKRPRRDGTELDDDDGASSWESGSTFADGEEERGDDATVASYEESDSMECARLLIATGGPARCVDFNHERLFDMSRLIHIPERLARRPFSEETQAPVVVGQAEA